MLRLRSFVFYVSAITLTSTFLGLSSSPALAQAWKHLPRRVVRPQSSKSIGNVPQSSNLRLALTLPLRNKAKLQHLLQELYDPSSPEYHHFLTVKQFTKEFGPSESDYQKVIHFAQAHGLNVDRTFADRLMVRVHGPVNNIDRAFHVTMRYYRNQSNRRKFYSPNTAPTIADNIPLLSVDGLSSLDPPRSMLKHAQADTVSGDTTGSGAGGQFLGSDMRAAYASGVTLAGRGQTVGLIELGPYKLSDVKQYFSSIGQPLDVPIYNVLLGVNGVCAGTPTTGGCDDGEEVIDIEQAISMAPHLSSLVVYEAYGSASDALTAFTQAASDDIAKQLSLSFGWGGTPSSEPGYEQVFLELAAQGQSVFVASGDSGANPGNVGYPGNSPNITDVGGTDLTTNGPGGTWLSESAWIGSGGGWNTQSPIPSWQLPVISNLNQGSTAYRNIPDVAMQANTDNYFCANESCSGGIGGTSLSAPRWAGFMALANEEAGGSPIGFLNPLLYQLGQSSSYSSIFHDITTGNDTNSSSPNLFYATQGYDLTTGWGSPDGQNMLDVLAPGGSSQASFSLQASPSTLNLTPGSSGTSVIIVVPVNSFSGTVQLTAKVIGAPAGISASISPSTASAGGTATLSISTTGATPGGSFLVAVTGTSNGLSQTADIKVGLPDFGITLNPEKVYLDQSSVADSTVTISPENGFSAPVALAIQSGIPTGVHAYFQPATTSSTSTLALAARSNAATSPGSDLQITAQSGPTTHIAPTLTLAVSAAVGTRGVGVPVNLSSAFNLTGIYRNGSTYTSGGLDGGGASYSEQLLGTDRVLNGVHFHLGAANVPDAVYAAGQTIPVPVGEYTTLQLMATGIDGEQMNQAITVTYENGTTSKLSQSFSDWFAPAYAPDETEAVAMPYRNTSSGTKDNRQFNVYGYTLPLNPRMAVKSITLPKNRDVVILAATLTRQRQGSEVNLSSQYNAIGVYTDGSTFSSSGGLDAGGTAYSANLLGYPSGAGTLVEDGTRFSLAPANTPNVVYGAGQTIPLPRQHVAVLRMLGSGVQGDQAAQPFTITYTDGSQTTFRQSFSDWFSPQGYSGESIAVKMSYRDIFNGSKNNQTFRLYEYGVSLNPMKVVQSITFPRNRNVVVLAMTLEKH